MHRRPFEGRHLVEDRLCYSRSYYFFFLVIKYFRNLSLGIIHGIPVLGLQYAGNELRALQAALKNPAANIGVIFGEGSKRAKRVMGFSNGGPLPGVHTKLSSQSAALGNVSDSFFFFFFFF